MRVIRVVVSPFNLLWSTHTLGWGFVMLSRPYINLQHFGSHTRAILRLIGFSVYLQTFPFFHSLFRLHLSPFSFFVFVFRFVFLLFPSFSAPCLPVLFFSLFSLVYIPKVSEDVNLSTNSNGKYEQLGELTGQESNPGPQGFVASQYTEEATIFFFFWFMGCEPAPATKHCLTRKCPFKIQKRSHNWIFGRASRSKVLLKWATESTMNLNLPKVVPSVVCCPIARLLTIRPAHDSLCGSVWRGGEVLRKFLRKGTS